MPPLPFDKGKDRAALELYARYNTTAKGILLLCHRKVYLFWRTELAIFRPRQS